MLVYGVEMAFLAVEVNNFFAYEEAIELVDEDHRQFLTVFHSHHILTLNVVVRSLLYRRL